MAQADLERCGINSQVASDLVKGGYDTPEKVVAASDEELDAIPNIGPATIQGIRDALQRGNPTANAAPADPSQLGENATPFGPGDPSVDPRVWGGDVPEDVGDRLAAAHLAAGPPYAQTPTGNRVEEAGQAPYYETYEQKRARAEAMQAAKERAELTASNQNVKAQFGNRLMQVMVEQWGSGPVQFHGGDLIPASEIPDELDIVHALNNGTLRMAAEYEGRGLFSATRPVETQTGVTGGLRQTGGPSLDPVRNPHLMGYAVPPGVAPGVGGVAAGSVAEAALIRSNALPFADTPQPPPAGRE